MERSASDLALVLLLIVAWAARLALLFYAGKR